MRNVHFLVLLALFPLAACRGTDPDRAGTGQPETTAASAGPAIGAEIIARRVWSGLDVDLSGRPSADGRLFSFVDWATGDLAIRDITTGTNRRLTNKGPWHESQEFADQTVLSPDGQRVAYTWFNQDQSFELRVTPVDKPSPRTVYRNENVTYVWPMAWSADGTAVLTLLADVDGSNRISFLPVEPGPERVIKSLDWRYAQKMDVSPDGRFIAYDFPTREDSPGRDIYVLASDGSSESRITEDPSASHAVVGWAPDGAMLWYKRERAGEHEVWRVGIANGRRAGAPELVKRDVWALEPLGFAKTGYFYGVSTERRQLRVAVVDPASGTMPVPPAEIASAAGNVQDGIYSPDGHYLAYRVESRGAPLVLRLLETDAETVIPMGLDYFAPRAWAPDGQSIYGQGASRGRRGIYRVDLRDRMAEPVRLAHPRGAASFPVVSPDGRTLFFRGTAPEFREPVLFAIDLATKSERVVYSASAVNRLDVSADGRHLAVTVHDSLQHRLVIMDLDGNVLRVLLQEPKPGILQSIRWTPDGRHVLVMVLPAGATDELSDLISVPVAGGPPKVLLSDQTFGYDLGIHPDGRRIAFTAGRPRFELWVMENLPGLPTVADAGATR